MEAAGSFDMLVSHQTALLAPFPVNMYRVGSSKTVTTVYHILHAGNLHVKPEYTCGVSVTSALPHLQI
jgi:hypothetical protein